MLKNARLVPRQDPKLRTSWLPATLTEIHNAGFNADIGRHGFYLHEVPSLDSPISISVEKVTSTGASLSPRVFLTHIIANRQVSSGEFAVDYFHININTGGVSGFNGSGFVEINPAQANATDFYKVIYMGLGSTTKVQSLYNRDIDIIGDMSISGSITDDLDIEADVTIDSTASVTTDTNIEFANASGCEFPTDTLKDLIGSHDNAKNFLRSGSGASFSSGIANVNVDNTGVSLEFLKKLIENMVVSSGSFYSQSFDITIPARNNQGSGVVWSFAYSSQHSTNLTLVNYSVVVFESTGNQVAQKAEDIGSLNLFPTGSGVASYNAGGTNARRFNVQYDSNRQTSSVKVTILATFTRGSSYTP